jgi:polyferredoxin
MVNNSQEKVIRNNIRKFKIRKIIQSVFFSIILLLFATLIKGDLNNAHPFCPYSSVCFGPMLLKGFLIFPISVIGGLIIAFLSMFFGRKFCSYVCFLGTLQEYIYKLNSKKNKFNQKIPQKYHRILIILKYMVFAFTLTAAFFSIQYTFMKYCPVLNLAFPTKIGVISGFVLFVIFVVGFFVERFWCRYLCPYAALMNLFQYLGKLIGVKRTKIFRNIKTSINCFNCENYCPMHIDIGYNEEISDPNCIQCYRCVRICSKTETSKSKCIYKDNI